MSANTLLAVSDHAEDEIRELDAALQEHLKEAAKLCQRIATISAVRSMIAYAAGENLKAAPDKEAPGKGSR